jgi:GTPase
MHGKNGEDLVINVPIGTLVKDSVTNKLIADLNEDNMIFLLCN